jgi:hypothetical protein
MMLSSHQARDLMFPISDAFLRMHILHSVFTGSKASIAAVELARQLEDLPIEDGPSGPWEQAWHLTMESSATVRASGVRQLCDLLRKGYEREAAKDMCALHNPSTFAQAEDSCWHCLFLEHCKLDSHLCPL